MSRAHHANAARKLSDANIAKRYLDFQRLRDKVRKVEIGLGMHAVYGPRDLRYVQIENRKEKMALNAGWPHPRRLRETVLERSCCFQFNLVCAPTSASRRLNSEIVKFFSRSELCREPAGLLPATGPSLGWLRRISVFRKNLRIRSGSVAYVSAIVV
jgi:hypothetical protein